MALTMQGDVYEVFADYSVIELQFHPIKGDYQGTLVVMMEYLIEIQRYINVIPI